LYVLVFIKILSKIEKDSKRKGAQGVELQNYLLPDAKAFLVFGAFPGLASPTKYCSCFSAVSLSVTW
jgi:hypothetical protein